MTRHSLLANLMLAILVFCAGCYSLLMLLDVFTAHGQQVKVPDVRYKSIEQAMSILDDVGLHYEIDSVYNEDFKPGIVIDQLPVHLSQVKSIRTVHLTMNMMSPPKVALPKELTEMAGANGVTLLKSLGFKNVSTDTIPSDKAGLILQVSVNGHKVAAGTKAAVNAQIVLSIGDGHMDIMEYDPIGQATRDSLIQQQIKQGVIKLEQDSIDNAPHIVY